MAGVLGERPQSSGSAKVWDDETGVGYRCPAGGLGAGFAYGTLSGHPECGEEAFLVRRGAGGQVYFEVRAFSRPDSLPARMAGPVGRLVQDLITRRYLGAMRSLSCAD
ncbi:DUF1990 domain-containing protein [Salinispora fenicalii]|uniref:DUF1990 domain-containing protein n=1 Tax=Salinispora fenicalii TaxID=1137263 RepID=UPI001CC77E6E|nr:DUF1990 domain-containing protein [Salinispora fenicalii]